MRVHSAVLLVVAGLLVMGPASAQSAPVALLGDSTGDVQLEIEGNAGGDPVAMSAMDLVALGASESADMITFHVEVADPSNGGKDQAIRVAVFVTFTYNDRQYRAWSAGASDGNAFGQLQSYDESQDSWSTFAQLYPFLEGSTWNIPVPRELVLDSMGTQPMPGRSLSGFTVHGRFIDASGCCHFGPAGYVPAPAMTYGDRMPDDGLGQVELDIQLGLAQTGHALLHSEHPTRASNGEASTYVFEIDARNTGDKADRFEIRTRGVPSSWDVTVPTSIVEVPAQGNLSVPVILTTPFAHQHGSLESFIVEMHSLSDATAVGRVELGIRYTAIPQPTGHHDTVWFHTWQSEGDVFATALAPVFGDWTIGSYMNAAEEDGIGTNEPAPSVGWVARDGGQSSTFWYIYLSPQLEMGIDWDMGRTGSLNFPIETQVPLMQASLEGTLYLRLPQDGADDDPRQRGFSDLAIARALPTEPVDIQGSGHVFETTIEGMPVADFIPWQPDASLYWRVNMTSISPDLFVGPHLGPYRVGGHAALPLDEYRDPVDDVYSTVQGLVIEIESEQQRLVNPGKTVIFRMQLADLGEGAGTYDLALSGPNHAWGQIIGDKTIHVAEGGQRPLVLAVTAPGDAADGDVADILLQATSRDDPARRTFVRVLAEVDVETQHPDEVDLVEGLQGELTSKREAPGAGVLVVLVLLAGMACVRRRS